jgi:hypothetical protein
MNYYRVKSIDDVDRALKLDLVNRGFIDETIQFVPQAERWQINTQLIELGMSQNANLIESNGSRFTQQPMNNDGAGQRKTKFQVMAEINQATALVTSAFNQAYQYQEQEYREIARRFFIKNSTDPEVVAFRLACLKRGVPESAFNIDAWDLQATRVMGSGNQTMEMAIAQQLLQMRNLFDPEPQREILRDVTFAVTGDPDKAARWVPDQPLRISDSVHDAQLSMGVLMQGLPVAVKTGQNHQECVKVALAELGMLIQNAEKSGGMASPQQIQGFQMVAQYVGQHLKILSEDKENKQFVAAAAKELSKLMNMVRAFAQRLQEQAKKQQGANGQMPPEVQAKLAATVIGAKSKAAISEKSHAQKTAQRQVSFEMEERRKQEEFANDQRLKNIEAIHEHNRNLLASMGEDAKSEGE